MMTLISSCLRGLSCSLPPMLWGQAPWMVQKKRWVGGASLCVWPGSKLPPHLISPHPFTLFLVHTPCSPAVAPSWGFSLELENPLSLHIKNLTLIQSLGSKTTSSREDPLSPWQTQALLSFYNMLIIPSAWHISFCLLFKLFVYEWVTFFLL